MKLIITESQYNYIFEQYEDDKLKLKYVESGLIPIEIFNEIKSVSEKTFYIQWLLKMVASKFVKYEDIYKFKKYFQIFNKYKSFYPIKDLGQIKDVFGVLEFEKTSKDIISKLEENEKTKSYGDDNMVSTYNIKKLESVGIKYLGVTNSGYQSFEIPPSLKGNKSAWSLYRNILGDCEGRDKGEMVSLCTMQDSSFFDRYFSTHPNDSYFIFYNKNDNLSPYQIHLGSMQFRNRKDDEVEYADKLFDEFLNFLIEKGISDVENFKSIFTYGVKLMDDVISEAFNRFMKNVKEISFFNRIILYDSATYNDVAIYNKDTQILYITNLEESYKRRTSDSFLNQFINWGELPVDIRVGFSNSFLEKIKKLKLKIVENLSKNLDHPIKEIKYLYGSVWDLNVYWILNNHRAYEDSIKFLEKYEEYSNNTDEISNKDVMDIAKGMRIPTNIALFLVKNKNNLN
jgi:hypothetical protein